MTALSSWVLVVALLANSLELYPALKSKPPAKVSVSSSMATTGDNDGDRNSPSSGETSNLITLLNFAQEVGSGSSSEKLRASADRLRQQFVRSFTTRYDLSTGPLAGGAIASGTLPTLLANINDDSHLSEEAKALRDVILMQLEEVGGEAAAKPSNILYYNEKLKNLREFRYALPFPCDTLQPVTLADKLQADSNSDISDGAPKMSGSDIMAAIKEKRLREEKEKQAAIALEAETAADIEEQPRGRKRDVLFRGLRAVGGIFRRTKNAEPGEGLAIDGADNSGGGSESANGAISESEQEVLLQGLLKDDSETEAAPSPSSRQEQVTAANIEQTLRRAKKQRLDNNPNLLEQQRKDVNDLKSALGEEVSRWRSEAAKAMSDAMGLAGELMVPAKPKRNYAISKPPPQQQRQEQQVLPALEATMDKLASSDVGVGDEEPSYASWRGSMETIFAARGIFPSPRRLTYSALPHTAFTVQRYDGSSDQLASSPLRTELPSDTHPNYVSLLHTCLTASLATYNLELSSVFESMESAIDKNLSDMREQVRVYQRQLEEEDESFLTSLSVSTASAIHGVLAINTTTSDADTQADRNNALGLKRARVLSRMAVGRVSQAEIDNTITAADNGDWEAESGSEGVTVKTIRSDKACGVITTDRTQGVTIVAFRGTLDPMDVVTDISFVSAPFKAVNDRLLRDFRDSETLIPEYESVEVHGGFLQSFESIVSQVEGCLDEVASHIRSSSSSGGGAEQRHTLLFTGHSMGGALAQLAAAYFCDRDDFDVVFDTNLVTIAAPATGNSDFVKYLNANAGPYGGIRYWNEYDPVPYLATVVGYELGGIPVKMPLRKGARRKFKRTTRNPFAVAGGFDGVMPHVVYQLGTLVYAFPILGYEINDSSSSSSASIVGSDEEEEDGNDQNSAVVGAEIDAMELSVDASAK